MKRRHRHQKESAGRAAGRPLGGPARRADFPGVQKEHATYLIFRREGERLESRDRRNLGDDIEILDKAMHANNEQESEKISEAFVSFFLRNSKAAWFKRSETLLSLRYSITWQ